MRPRFISRPLLVACSLVALVAALSGCSSTSADAYSKQISDAQTAYESGKITTAEYLQLKQNAQNAYLQRQASGN